MEQSMLQRIQQLTFSKEGFGVQFQKLDSTHISNMSKYVQAKYQRSLLPEFEVFLEQIA